MESEKIRTSGVMGEHRLRGERGQLLVLFALMLVVILGVIALAVDGGYAYVQRRRMQYAADAAAVVGARVLVLGGSDAAVEAAVREYATQNGADAYMWRRLSATRIEVRTSYTFGTFFAPVVGISSMTARARSEADVSGVSAVRGVMPIAVREFPFLFDRSYVLWSNDSRPAPGNFGWLDWNGGSRSTRELAENICNPGNSGLQRVGGWVWGAPGVRASHLVRYCLNQWIGKTVIVVLYDAVYGRGARTSYHIAGFAAFVLEGYSFHGHNKYIRGRFVRYIAPGEGGGPNYGLTTIRLGPN